jgi:predicted HicB family RNase H-like nuclease
MNTIEINGYRAVIQYDPDIDMFRGEFVGLSGGADFYAKDIDSLRKESEISLKVFLDICQENGIEPRKAYSSNQHRVSSF